MSNYDIMRQAVPGAPVQPAAVRIVLTWLRVTRVSSSIVPRTGWPVAGLASATVAADTCLEAGIVSTVAMLKGADGPAWLAEAPPHVYVDAEGRLGGSALTRPTSGTAPSASSCR